MIESLEEISDRLFIRYSSEEWMLRLTMPKSSDGFVVRALERLIERPLPEPFVRVAGRYALPGHDLGVSFGSSLSRADYVNYVLRLNRDGLLIADIAQARLIGVCAGDPYVVLMDIETGVMHALLHGSPLDATVDLAIDFEQLMVGLGNIGLARGTDQIEAVRSDVATSLDSPLRFWANV